MMSVPRRGSGYPVPSAAAFMLCCCHADRGRFSVSFNNLLRYLYCGPGPACDAVELIICQQYLIRCAEPVQVLICLRLFELLLTAQALCDVTEFHVMASHEEIFTIHVCVLSQLLCYELFTAQFCFLFIRAHCSTASVTKLSQLPHNHCISHR